MPPAVSSDEERSEAELEVPLRTKKPANGRQKKSVSREPDLSDDDDDSDAGPSNSTKRPTNGGGRDEVEDDDGDEEEEEDEDDEQVYTVETIEDHRLKGKKPIFLVKWEGYENPEDRTWEDEDNLKENASEILQEYYRKIGGREKMFADVKTALGTKKRGRPPSGATPTGNKRAKKREEHPSESSPPAGLRKQEWKPPAGNWDEEISQLDMMEDDVDGQLICYVTWKNGHKTQHSKEIIYKRAPQKMLRFYERHVRVIKTSEAGLAGNGDHRRGRDADEA